jgi:hypothetical protein
VRYLAVLCGALIVPVGATGQQPPAKSMRWAHVTYLTTASAYIDAGRAEGLRDNSRVEVVRGDSTVAVLAVTFLATHQAACDVSGIAASLVVGDSVRFTPAAHAPDSSVAVTRQPAPNGRPPLPPRAGGVLRGRAGLYYLLIQSRAAGAACRPGRTGSAPTPRLRHACTRRR